MKKARLCFLLPLLAFHGMAHAIQPNGTWLEFYSGKLKADESPAEAIDNSGDARGFASAFPISPTAYIRGDWREETFEWQLGGASTLETTRTITSLTIGMVEIGHPEYRLFGEIGALQVEWEHALDGLAELVGKETTPMLRLGITGEDGRFSWYLVGDWASKALQADGSEDRERWWNAYLGYQLTSHLEIGVRYANNDEFRNTGASLRIRF